MIKIKETSKAGVIANVNGVYGKLENGKFIPYTEKELNKKTSYKEELGWVEYESIDEWFYQYHEQKKIKKTLADKRVLIEENPDNYTLEEIWQCAVYITKHTNSWRGADLLMKSSKFKNALNKLNDYTITPIDGFILIKSGNKRYGNKRGWLSIEEILN